MNTLTELDGLQRCLSCHHLPTIKIEEAALETVYTFICEEHGFEARGNSLEQGKEHWNKFITGYAKLFAKAA